MRPTTPLYDLMDPRLINDPFTGFGRAREEPGLVRAGMPGIDHPVWLVTRHEDLRTVLGDRRFVNNPASVPGLHLADLRAQAATAQGVRAEHLDHVVRSLLDVDGVEHTRLRRLVSRAFTPRRVAQLRPRVQELTEQLLDTLPGQAQDGVVDLVEHFNYVLPVTVICELVGVPAADRPSWLRWSRALTSMDPQAVGAAVADMVDNIRALIGRRRTHPADDLISDLIRAQDADGDRLAEPEMITLILTLVTAGHETTALLLGNGTVALLTHPVELAKLRADEGLAAQAVDELVRWCSSILAARPRYAAEDVDLGGSTVRRGDAVIPVLVGANHDPAVFADPGRFDITRTTTGRDAHHLGFGDGLHYCLGAPLARQEAEVAFLALLRRFPDLALAVPARFLRRAKLPLTWRLEALPVRLGR